MFERFDGEEFYERQGPLSDYREIYFPENQVSVLIHGTVRRIAQEDQRIKPSGKWRPFAYTRHAADGASPRGIMTSAQGLARDAKAGAVVRDDRGRVFYLAHLASWPAEIVGKRVSVLTSVNPDQSVGQAANVEKPKQQRPEVDLSDFVIFLTAPQIFAPRDVPTVIRWRPTGK